MEITEVTVEKSDLIDKQIAPLLIGEDVRNWQLLNSNCADN